MTLRLDAVWAPEALTLVVEHDGDEVIAWRPRVAHGSAELPEPAQEPGGARRREVRGRAVSHRRAPGPVPARHPVSRALLARGREARRGRLSLEPGAGSTAVPGWAVRRGRAAPARGARAPDPPEHEPGRRRGDVPPRPGPRPHRSYGRGLRDVGQGAVEPGVARRGAPGDGTARRRARPRPRSAGPRPCRRRRRRGPPAGPRRARRRPAQRRTMPPRPTPSLARSLERDPLDVWTRDLAGLEVAADAPTLLDVALEYDSLGAWRDAVRLLELPRRGRARPGPGRGPAAGTPARSADPRGRWRPARPPIGIASSRVRRPPCTAWPRASTTSTCSGRTSSSTRDDARAWAILGHWLYFQRRHHDAIAAWTTSTALDPSDPVVWRNRAVAAFNVLADPDAAREHYERAPRASHPVTRASSTSVTSWRSGPASCPRRASRCSPASARRSTPATTSSSSWPSSTPPRAGRRSRSTLLRARWFQPWEGGEGQVLSAWDEALLALARRALDAGDPGLARSSTCGPRSSRWRASVRRGIRWPTPRSCT